MHIAGSKGKGSTSAMCEAGFRRAGLSTALFSSPHLIDVRERIRINGEIVDEGVFVEHFWDVWDVLEAPVEHGGAPATAEVPSALPRRFLCVSVSPLVHPNRNSGTPEFRPPSSVVESLLGAAMASGPGLG